VPAASAKRRRSSDDRDTRRRILDAALEIFGEHGFDGARTRDIAAAAGVNLGLLQYHFGGKEKLWRATVDDVFGALWAALDGTRAVELRGPEALAAVVRVAVRFAAAHPALVRLMNDEGKRDGPRLRWLVDRHGRRLFETVSTVLGQARARGLVADVGPIHLYYVLVGSVGLMFSQAAECRRLAGVDPTASPAMIDAHADALLGLLLGVPAARTA
jgi:TetR/AcrR family transcriptional regulator